MADAQQTTQEQEWRRDLVEQDRAAGQQAREGSLRGAAVARDIDSGSEEESEAGGGSSAVKEGLKFGSDIKELLPALTIIGIVVSLARMNYRLIFGNLLNGKFLSAEPLSAPFVFITLAADLLTFFLTIILAFFIWFLVLALTDPCELLKFFNANNLGFIKGTLIKAGCWIKG